MFVWPSLRLESRLFTGNGPFCDKRTRKVDGISIYTIVLSVAAGTFILRIQNASRLS